MSILQINIWTCEVCGHISITHYGAYEYEETEVTPPEGEDWKRQGGDIPGFYGKLACPKCPKDPS